MKKATQDPETNQEEIIIEEKKKSKVQATEKKAKSSTTTAKPKTTKKAATDKAVDAVEKKKKPATTAKATAKASVKKPKVEKEIIPIAAVSEKEVNEDLPVLEKATATSESPIAEITESGIPSASNIDIVIAEDSDEHDDISHDLNETEIEELYGHLTKDELIETLTLLLQEDNINNIKSKVTQIKVSFHKIIKEEKHQLYEKFLSEGGVKEEYLPAEDEAELRFKAAFEVYKERKNKYNEEQEKLKSENLALKNQIIEDLKVLINSEETLKETYDDFKHLQEKWKEIGQVPHTENNNLWQNYHFLIEKFFDKVKINKELKDLDLRKNMEAKIQICEKTEELLLESSIIISFKKLQEYHEEWKEIGPVPMDKKDEIWERFKTASDQINQRRHEFYETQHKQEDNNLIAKTALCEKAEQILSLECVALKEWQDATNELNDLLKIWKTIGQAPKKQNNEIWARFKTYLDSFFANRNDFFGKVKDEQQNNYNLKVELCLQAEAIKDRNDWKSATNELIDLQKQWKTIGPAPRKQQDKVWLRFRAACDEFFKKKSEYFSHINEHEAENLKLKEALIEKIKSFKFGENRNDNLTALKELQREWSEIGHIPIKEKERIQTEFRKVINTCFEQLKISNAEASTINYKQKVDSMKDSGGGKQFIGKEKMFISGKISKLREDINLWENNIGFLANSKQADILKNEFAKKIDQAKQEVILLEAKFKMLINS